MSLAELVVPGEATRRVNGPFGSPQRDPAGQAARPGKTPSKCVARSDCRKCGEGYLAGVGADALSMAANSSSLSSGVRAREFCRT